MLRFSCHCVVPLLPFYCALNLPVFLNSFPIFMHFILLKSYVLAFHSYLFLPPLTPFFRLLGFLFFNIYNISLIVF